MKKQLIIAAVVIIVLAGIALGIHFFKKDCIIPEIIFSPEKPQAGQTVSFKVVGSTNQMLTWDFGDGASFEGIDSAIHIYDNSDNYVVTVITSEKCQSQKQVIVDPARKMQRVTPTVSYPSEIHVGEAVTFNDATKEASQWSWKIPETNESGSFSSFSTTFQNEGIYHISLSVNGIYIKGDTTIEFNVLQLEGAKAQHENPQVTQMEVAKPKPEIMPKPESTSRHKEEKIAKPKPEPVLAAKKEVATPKNEAKPKPTVEAKPKSVASPKPPESVYLKDAEFSSLFVDIANALGDEGNNSSADWREKIVAQSAPPGTMNILLQIGNNEPKPMTLESFKKQQIIASSPYNVNAVKDIKRKKDNSIYQITVLVTKN